MPHDQDPAAPKRRGLVQNMSYSVGAQLGYVLTQMGVLAALSQYKGPEAVGEFGLALATTTPIFMLANLGVRTSVATDVTRRFQFAEYAGLTTITTVLAVITSIGFGFWWAESSSTFTIILIVTLMKAFESFSKFAHGAFQQSERMDKVAISLLSRGMLTLMAFWLFLALGAETEIAFLAQLVVWGAMALLYDYPLASKLHTSAWARPRIKMARFRAILVENYSLGVAQGLGALIAAVPRLALARYAGLEAVGIFTVVTYFLQAGTMVIDGASHALVSRFAHLRNQDNKQTLRALAKRLLIGAASLSVLGVLVAYFAGYAILGFLFGAEFAAADDLLLLVALTISAKLFSVVPQCLMHADRRFSSLMVQQLFILLISLAALAVWVPGLGYIGAGYAVLTVGILRLALLTFTAYRKSSVSRA